MSSQMRLVAVAAMLAALSSRAAQAAADGTSGDTAPLAQGRRRPFLARPGEPQGSVAPAAVTPLDAAIVAEGNASAAGQAFDREVDDSEVDAGNLTEAGHAPGRRLQLSLDVWCVCSAGENSRVCGGMYYTLFQCDPRCPGVCHAKGMSFVTCDGSREVSWFQRLRYKWTDCANSPLR